MKTKIVLICIILLLVATIFAQNENMDTARLKKIESEEQKLLLKGFLAMKQMCELQKRTHKLLAKKKEVKTDIEKVNIQKQIESLSKSAQKKILDIKLANFELLFYTLLRASKIIDGKRIFPQTADAISGTTPISLTTIKYNGGLEAGLKNAKKIILLSEKKADSKGRKITLFLDGHVEVSEREKE